MTTDAEAWERTATLYREALLEALPILREYARKNPKWGWTRSPGATSDQDPYGVHALLAKVEEITKP